jgi:hypothetical protein
MSLISGETHPLDAGRLGRWQTEHAFERSIETAVLIANSAQELRMRVEVRGGQRRKEEKELEAATIVTKIPNR